MVTSLHGKPWYRSNCRQRFWRHTHATWLTEDGVAEVARRARLGHNVKGMARVYDHVTPEMERQVSSALEERWVGSVLAL